MAIDHLEGFCKYKQLHFNKMDKVPTGWLNYDAYNMHTDENKKKQILEIMSSFDSYTDRLSLTLDQLTIIGQYVTDYEKIKDIFSGKAKENVPIPQKKVTVTKKDEKSTLEVVPEETVT